MKFVDASSWIIAPQDTSNTTAKIMVIANTLKAVEDMFLFIDIIRSMKGRETQVKDLKLSEDENGSFEKIIISTYRERFWN